MKKKIISAALACVMATSAAATFMGCAPRDEILKIYNWGDYIDEDLIGDFEDWYQAETGKTITVEYDTFETNEDMMFARPTTWRNA